MLVFVAEHSNIIDNIRVALSFGRCADELVIVLLMSKKIG